MTWTVILSLIARAGTVYFMYCLHKAGVDLDAWGLLLSMAAVCYADVKYYVDKRQKTIDELSGMLERMIDRMETTK